VADELEAKRVAEEQETKRQAEELEAKRVAEELEAKRVAEELEAKRQVDELEAKRAADETEAKRLADETEAKRLAEELEAKRLADEAEAARLEAERIEAERAEVERVEELKRKEQEDAERLALEQAKQEELKSAAKSTTEPPKDGDESKLSKTQKKNKKNKKKKGAAKDDDKDSIQDVSTPVTKSSELVDPIVGNPPSNAELLEQPKQSADLVDLGPSTDGLETQAANAQTPPVAEPVPASLFDEPTRTPAQTPKGKKQARPIVADSDLSDAYQSAQSGPPTPTPEQQEFKGTPAPDAPPKPVNGSWNGNQQQPFFTPAPTPNGPWHANGAPGPTSPQAGRNTPTPRTSRNSLQDRLAGTAAKVTKTLNPGHKSSNSGQKKEGSTWGNWF
jgi:hypothetical protein